MKKVLQFLLQFRRFEHYPAAIVYHHPLPHAHEIGNRIGVNRRAKPIRYDHREKVWMIHLPRVVGTPTPRQVQQGSSYRLRTYRWVPVLEHYEATVRAVVKSNQHDLLIGIDQLVA